MGDTSCVHVATFYGDVEQTVNVTDGWARRVLSQWRHNARNNRHALTRRRLPPYTGFEGPGFAARLETCEEPDERKYLQ
jgi:hypothetical protein